MRQEMMSNDSWALRKAENGNYESSTRLDSRGRACSTGTQYVRLLVTVCLC